MTGENASSRTHYVGDDCDPPHTWPSRWTEEPTMADQDRTYGLNETTEGPPDYDPADDLRAALARQERELKAALEKEKRLRDGIRQHREEIESEGLAGSLPSKRLWALLDGREGDTMSEQINDPEVAVLSEVYWRLRELDHGQQRRVVDWLSARIEADQIPTTTAKQADR